MVLGSGNSPAVAQVLIDGQSFPAAFLGGGEIRWIGRMIGTAQIPQLGELDERIADVVLVAGRRYDIQGCLVVRPGRRLIANAASQIAKHEVGVRPRLPISVRIASAPPRLPARPPGGSCPGRSPGEPPPGALA